VLKKLGYAIPHLEKYDEIEKYLRDYIYLVESNIKRWNSSKLVDTGEKLLAWHQADYISTILTTGLYAFHLNRWLPYYNDSSLMIIDGEEMFQDPGSVIEKVQEFLRIPRLILRQDFEKDPSTGYYCYRDWKIGKLQCLPDSKTRTRGGKKKLNPKTYDLLRKFYANANEDLFRLIGRRLKWS